MSEPRTKNVLSFRERCEVLDFLRTVCVKVDGFARYQTTEEFDATYVWTDSTVAKRMADALGRPVTTANVEAIRRDMIGELAPAKPADPTEALDDRLHDAEREIDDLKRAVQAHELQIRALVKDKERAFAALAEEKRMREEAEQRGTTLIEALNARVDRLDRATGLTTFASPSTGRMVPRSTADAAA